MNLAAEDLQLLVQKLLKISAEYRTLCVVSAEKSRNLSTKISDKSKLRENGCQQSSAGSNEQQAGVLTSKKHSCVFISYLFI